MKKEVETLPPSRLKGSTAQHRKKISLKKEVAKRWMINRGRVSNEACKRTNGREQVLQSKCTV